MPKEWTDGEREAFGAKMRASREEAAEKRVREKEARLASHGFRKPAPGPAAVAEGQDVSGGVPTVMAPAVRANVTVADMPAHLQAPAARFEGRVGTRQIHLTLRADGQMVSLEGPCVCGARKREWHTACLRQAVPASLGDQIGETINGRAGG